MKILLTFIFTLGLTSAVMAKPIVTSCNDPHFIIYMINDYSLFKIDNGTSWVVEEEMLYITEDWRVGDMVFICVRDHKPTATNLNDKTAIVVRDVTRVNQ